MDKHEIMAGLRAEAAAKVERECDPGVRMVFGEGNMDAALVLVGEAPGGTEDRVGKPFVGQAGKLLERELKSAGISREDIYITNVAKCRPVKMQEGRASNRTPTVKEAASWTDLLMRELEALQPKVILCLGGIAASVLIHPSFRMNAERGLWFDGPFGSRIMATFHPSYLLRWETYGGGSDVLELFRKDLRGAIDASQGAEQSGEQI